MKTVRVMKSSARRCCVVVALAAISPGLLSAADAPVKKPTDATEKVKETPEQATNADGKKATTVKPVKPRPTPVVKKTDPGVVAVTEAVKKLTEEYRAYLKDPESAKVRTTSNYATDNADPTVTNEIVYKALDRSIAGDVRVDAYVKWQLLSYVSGLPDDKDVPKLLNLYGRAPLPPAHPGMDRQMLQRALSQPGASQRENENAVNDEFGQVLDRYEQQIAPILGYRDSLFSKLPTRGDCAAAGWEDVRDRIKLGLKADAFAGTVAGATRSWATSDATPAQLTAMIQFLETIKRENDKTESQAYTRVVFEEKNNKLEWRARDSVGGGLFKDLTTSLREARDNPGGGLQIKTR